jgi:hypothetical protein
MPHIDLLRKEYIGRIERGVDQSYYLSKEHTDGKAVIEAVP